VGALRDNTLKNMVYSAHKYKIKKGDKVILWVSGKDAGCYALGVVTWMLS